MSLLGSIYVLFSVWESSDLRVAGSLLYALAFCVGAYGWHRVHVDTPVSINDCFSPSPSTVVFRQIIIIPFCRGIFVSLSLRPIRFYCSFLSYYTL